MSEIGMTRQQIKASARALVRAYTGTEFEADPVLTNNFVDWVVQELCRVTDSVEVEYTTDIEDGVQDYCLPGLKYLESAQITRSAANGGQKRSLALRDTRSQSLSDCGWRTDPQSGDPTIAVTQGRGRIALYPIPNYDAAGGLVLRGFGVISREMWPAESDICPLSPSYVHQTVVYGVAERIAILIGNQPAIAEMRQQWRYSKGQYWAEAHTFTDTGSHRADDAAGFRVPSVPLNM